MIYYTVVTSTTAGYGDISPQTPLGQIIYILYWIFFTVVCAVRIAAVIKMNGLSSPYEKTYKGAANK